MTVTPHLHVSPTSLLTFLILFLPEGTSHSSLCTKCRLSIYLFYQHHSKPSLSVYTHTVVCIPTPAVCELPQTQGAELTLVSHSAPPFPSPHTFLQFQYTACATPIYHSTMQNTEISQFWATRLQKCEWSHKQPVEEFTAKHPGYQRNTPARGCAVPSGMACVAAVCHHHTCFAGTDVQDSSQRAVL